MKLTFPVIDHPNVTAVLFAGLPGQESGNSLVDVLYGAVNPAGHLLHTIAKNESDYGNVLNSSVSFDPFPQSDFTEGVYIDYKHFDRYNITPRFEFGYGLSYTNFTYSSLSISAAFNVSNTTVSRATYPDPSISIIQGGHPELWDVLFTVSASISNVGPVAGAEVAQLYLGIPGSPLRQLRGFDKLYIQPNASATAVFELTRRDLSVWDVVAQQWKLQSGEGVEYKLWIGASSRDLRLSGVLVV